MADVDGGAGEAIHLHDRFDRCAIALGQGIERVIGRDDMFDIAGGR